MDEMLSHAIIDTFPSEKQNVFTMNNDYVVVASNLNFEDVDKYLLKISVTDDGGLTSELSADITIYVNDVNEAPSFSSSLSTSSVLENSLEGTLIGIPLVALDPDVFDFGKLKYSIQTNRKSTNITPKTTEYILTTTTANIIDAGTKDNVQIKMFGNLLPLGTPWIDLSTPTTTLEQSGLTTTTTFTATYVGDVTSLQLRTTGSDGWMLSKVEIGRQGHSHALKMESSTETATGSNIWVQGMLSAPKMKVSTCILMDEQPKSSTGGSFSCPSGYRLPLNNEWSRVSSCVNHKVTATVDVVTSVGGCDCNNRRYCVLPSIETIRLGKQCGDTTHLHVCVRIQNTALSTSVNSFDIDSSTGQLYLTDDSIDYEKLNTPFFLLKIRVTDMNGLFGDIDKKISVTDQNEPPSMRTPYPNGIFDVSEDFTANTIDPRSGKRGVIGYQLIVEDYDNNDDYTSLKVTIVNGASDQTFMIDDNNYIVLYPTSNALSLNYEKTPSYSLTLRTTDDGGLWSDQSLVIRVTDVNEPPTVNNENYRFYLEENLPRYTLVGNSPVTGTDPDTDDTLTHSISTNEGSYDQFLIKSNSGQLSTNAILDYEVSSLLYIIVRITDSSTLYSEANVTILIEDVNEKPSFQDESTTYDINFSSESTTGINVGAPLIVDDVDFNDRFSFELVDTTPPQPTNGFTTGSLSCFVIGRSSGQMSFDTTANDCLSNSRVHTFLATATDTGGLMTSIHKKIVVYVIQANRPPVISSSSSLSVAENSLPGTVVGTLSATDPDNDKITWSLIPPSSLFVIDSSTGQVTTSTLNLNHEIATTYSLHAVATESSTLSKLMDARPFTITIINVNEAPFITDVENRTIDENSPLGTYIGGPIAASDPDQNAILIYSMDGKLTGEDLYITMDVTDGQLLVSKSMDYEAESTHRIMILVTDEGNLSSEVVTIDVHVLDVNEPPIISSNVQSIDVSEDAIAGTILFTVTAIDNESGGDLSYTVGDGSGDETTDLFVVTAFSKNGQATVQLANDDLDYEKRTSYEVYICAVDNGGLSTCTHVNVNVRDVADMTIDSFSGNTAHNTNGGDVVRIVGSNFGPIDGGLQKNAIVATYGTPGISNKKYTATNCQVVGNTNTMIECETVAGAGGNLEWMLLIQTPASNLQSIQTIQTTLTTSYSRPNITSITLTPELIPTTGRTSVVLEGNNLGVEGTLVLTYGGEFGDLYTAKACRYVSSSKVECQTTSGVGVKHNWLLTVNDLQSSVVVAESSYAPPSIHFLEGAVNMSTTGGEIIYILGTNFGPVTTRESLKDGVTTAPIVRYGILDENATALRSTATTSTTTSLSNAVYVATDCVVRIANVQIMCTTASGFGVGQQWEVTIGSQTSQISDVTSSYRPPVILSVTGPGVEDGATVGGQEVLIQGYGFHPNALLSAQYGRSSLEYTASACTVIVDHFTIRCLTSPGTGRNHPWVVIVDDQQSPPHTRSNASYGPPVITQISGDGSNNANTNGGQPVQISGSNFGPTGTSVFAMYRLVQSDTSIQNEENKNEEYVASNCIVNGNGHTSMSCITSAGVGRPLFWRVQVDGQNSTIPTTSYARPIIYNITNSDNQPVTSLSTVGGEKIIIHGAYFGRLGENADVISVTYGVMGNAYNAKSCMVVINSPATKSMMECISSPGVGTNLRFLVNVGGQLSMLSSPISRDSTSSSATTLSYANPTIISIDPQTSATSDNILVTVSGINFGPIGTLVGVTFGESHSNPFGDGAVRTIHRNHNELQFNVPLYTVNGGHLVQVHVTDTSAAQLNVSHSSNTIIFNILPPTLNTVRSENSKDLNSGIMLFGSSFGKSNTTGSIKIGDIVVPTSSWNHNQIIMNPSSLDGDLSITVGMQTSNTITNFASKLLDLNPIVSKITPKTGPTEGNIKVTINGERLGASAAKVYIGENLCTPIILASAEKIECMLPIGSGDQKVIVNNGWQRGETDLNNQYVYFNYGTPEIKSIHPSNSQSTEYGEIIRLEGYNFASDTSENILTYTDNGNTKNRVQLKVLTSTTSSLTFVLPEGSGGSSTIRLQVGVKISDPIAILRPSPTVTNIEPKIASTSGGELIKISGSNFGVSPIINIFGRKCNTIENTHQNLTCIMPSGGGELNMDLNVMNGVSSSSTIQKIMSYYAPSVKSIAGTLGSTSGGSTLMIEGQNFGFTKNLSISLVSTTGTTGRKGTNNGRRLLGTTMTDTVSCEMTVVSSNHTHARVTVPPCFGQSLTVQVNTAYQKGQPPNIPSFGFDLPTLSYASPLPADARNDTIYIHGNNFGGIAHDVVVRLNGVPCQSSTWLQSDPEYSNTSYNFVSNSSGGLFPLKSIANAQNNRRPVLACVSSTTTVGTRNVSVDVAGITYLNDSMLPNNPLVTLRCKAGYHGDIGTECKPCPVGAICDGGLSKPRSQNGWWRLNTTRFVKCLPSHACLGNNTCSVGYEGVMCNSCGSGHYRAQQDCDRCNAESNATFILTITVVILFVVTVLLLTKYDFKLASITALVDFMQTIAILGHLPLPWPESMRWMFKVASIFIFNFQMAAPECYDDNWRYDYLW